MAMRRRALEAVEVQEELRRHEDGQEPHDAESVPRITVTWGEELYAPVQFHSFRAGALTLEFEVLPPETIEQAHARVLDVLRKLTRKQYEVQRDEFLARFRELNAKMKER